MSELLHAFWCGFCRPFIYLRAITRAAAEIGKHSAPTDNVEKDGT